MEDVKPWWSSKTLIVNAVALIAMIAGGVGFELDQDLQASIVGGVLAVINIGLRLVTHSKIT